MIRNPLASYQLNQPRPLEGQRTGGAPERKNSAGSRVAPSGFNPQDRVTFSQEAQSRAQAASKPTDAQAAPPVRSEPSAPPPPVSLPRGTTGVSAADLPLQMRYDRFVNRAFAQEPTPRGALVRLSA